jgi:hypothetical protein
MANSVSEMKKKLLLVERQFSKGYGVYSLDPDKKGQYSAFLRKHNLKPTMGTVNRISSVKESLGKDPSRQELQAAQSLIEKWHAPLKSLDKLKEKKPMKKASLLRK